MTESRSGVKVGGGVKVGSQDQGQGWGRGKGWGQGRGGSREEVMVGVESGGGQSGLVEEV